MKLLKKYENILKLMAPTWMKKLRDANWDTLKLSKRNKSIIASNAQKCFIGEMHCMTSSYLQTGDSRCEECATFCEKVPNSIHVGYPMVVRKTMLEDIAEHFIEFHTDLIALKVQQRAHLVFK